MRHRQCDIVFQGDDSNIRRFYQGSCYKNHWRGTHTVSVICPSLKIADEKSAKPIRRNNGLFFFFFSEPPDKPLQYGFEKCVPINMCSYVNVLNALIYYDYRQNTNRWNVIARQKYDTVIYNFVFFIFSFLLYGKFHFCYGFFFRIKKKISMF